MGENVRQPIKKSESLNIPMNTTAINSLAISDAPTDVSSEESLDMDEANVKTTRTRKPVITANTPVISNYAISSSPVPLLNQLPPITWFSGEEQPDGEMFQDWLEQFESVAQLGERSTFLFIL